AGGGRGGRGRAGGRGGASPSVVAAGRRGRDGGSPRWGTLDHRPEPGGGRVATADRHPPIVHDLGVAELRAGGGVRHGGERTRDGRLQLLAGDPDGVLRPPVAGGQARRNAAGEGDVVDVHGPVRLPLPVRVVRGAGEHALRRRA